MNPLVSIIVIGYNQGRYVRQAMESALAQTYPNVEIIAVDNGSTDNSRDILREFAGRAKLLLFEKNEPVTKRMNQALKECRGEYVSTLFSDDVYLPEKTAVQMEAFSKLGPEYGVVYGPGLRKNIYTGETWEEFHVKLSGYILKPLLKDWFRGGFIHPISPLARRRCFDDFPYAESIFAEGESIYLRLATKYHFHHLPQPLVVMSEHDMNMGKAVRENLRLCIQVLDNLETEATFPKELLADLQSARAEMYRLYGWQAVRVAYDPKWARSCVQGILKHRPSFLLNLKGGLMALGSVLPASFLKWVNETERKFRHQRMVVRVKEGHA